MFSDENGDSRLVEMDIPGPEVSYDGDPRSLALRDIPASTVHITELLEWRPKLALHPPPRRQLVVILQGVLEISTTAGERRRFEAGDCLLAEDMEGKGHMTEDVGTDRLVTLSIALLPEWRWPGT